MGIEENEIGGIKRMTKKSIADSCKKNKLYMTPYLNDVLYLHYQGYQQIECLEEYTGLKCLWLESNAISEISGLDNQKELKCLFLHNNIIKKIQNLQFCSQLDTINLSHNYIHKIENCGTDILPVLNTLNLSHNCIRTIENIENLSECKTVSVLDLSHNRINDILIVNCLATMSELKVLCLTGNPVVNEIPSYRKTLINACKKLTYLDDRPVFPRDRACAEAWKRGGYEEENREHIRWNKEDRRKIRASVNATLAFRRKRNDCGDQIEKLPSSSDDEDDRNDNNNKKYEYSTSLPYNNNMNEEEWKLIDDLANNITIPNYSEPQRNQCNNITDKYSQNIIPPNEIQNTEVAEQQQAKMEHNIIEIKTTTTTTTKENTGREEYYQNYNRNENDADDDKNNNINNNDETNYFFKNLTKIYEQSSDFRNCMQENTNKTIKNCENIKNDNNNNNNTTIQETNNLEERKRLIEELDDDEEPIFEKLQFKKENNVKPASQSMNQKIGDDCVKPSLLNELSNICNHSEILECSSQSQHSISLEEPTELRSRKPIIEIISTNEDIVNRPNDIQTINKKIINESITNINKIKEVIEVKIDTSSDLNILEECEQKTLDTKISTENFQINTNDNKIDFKIDVITPVDVQQIDQNIEQPIVDESSVNDDLSSDNNKCIHEIKHCSKFIENDDSMETLTINKKITIIEDPLTKVNAMESFELLESAPTTDVKKSKIESISTEENVHNAINLNNQSIDSNLFNERNVAIESSSINNNLTIENPVNLLISSEIDELHQSIDNVVNIPKERKNDIIKRLLSAPQSHRKFDADVINSEYEELCCIQDIKIKSIVNKVYGKKEKYYECENLINDNEIIEIDNKIQEKQIKQSSSSGIIFYCENLNKILVENVNEKEPNETDNNNNNNNNNNNDDVAEAKEEDDDDDIIYEDCFDFLYNEAITTPSEIIEEIEIDNDNNDLEK